MCDTRNSVKWIALLVILVLLTGFYDTGVAQPADNQSLQRFEYSSPQMGTRFRIVLYANNSQLARQASDAAFERASELNVVFSDYLPDSELSRLSASSGTGQAVPVSDDLYQILLIAQSLSGLSNGAFDITTGPFTRRWRAMRDNNQMGLPSAAEIQELSASVGYENITIDKTEMAVRLENKGMMLDLGAIAKGYAADEMLTTLNSFGVETALVDAGGDLVLGNAPPGLDGWRIQLPLPGDSDTQNVMILSNCAVATSGDLFQFIEIDGVRYSHIVNPVTGLGLTDRRRVTVVAPNGAHADGLSSAVSVLGPQKGLSLLRRLSETEGIITWLDESIYLSESTPDFRQFISSGSGNIHSPDSGGETTP